MKINLVLKSCLGWRHEDSSCFDLSTVRGRFEESRVTCDKRISTFTIVHLYKADKKMLILLIVEPF